MRTPSYIKYPWGDQSLFFCHGKNPSITSPQGPTIQTRLSSNYHILNQDAPFYFLRFFLAYIVSFSIRSLQIQLLHFCYITELCRNKVILWKGAKRSSSVTKRIPIEMVYYFEKIGKGDIKKGLKKLIKKKELKNFKGENRDESRNDITLSR